MGTDKMWSQDVHPVVSTYHCTRPTSVFIVVRTVLTSRFISGRHRLNGEEWWVHSGPLQCTARDSMKDTTLPKIWTPRWYPESTDQYTSPDPWQCRSGPSSKEKKKKFTYSKILIYVLIQTQEYLSEGPSLECPKLSKSLHEYLVCSNFL